MKLVWFHLILVQLYSYLVWISNSSDTGFGEEFVLEQ